jgi:HEAT repeat protein
MDYSPTEIMLWWTYQQLRSKNVKTRQSAVEKLASLGDRAAVDPLLFALNDSEPEIRFIAARALLKLRDERAVEPLIKLLRDSACEVRQAAVEALAKTGDPRATSWLVGALRDPDAGVRSRAAHGLDGLGWQPNDPAERALQAVASGDEMKAAAFGSVAIEPLEATLRTGPSYKRVAAVEALSAIQDARAGKPLLEALKDEDGAVRVAAIAALTRISDPRAWDSVFPMLKDADARVRAAAVEAVTVLGGVRSLASLLPMLKDKSWEVRHAVIAALAVLRDPGAAEPLADALLDQMHNLREAAAQALGEIRDERSIAPLILALKDEHNPVRQAAAVALQKINRAWARTTAAQQVLPEIKAASQNTEYWVRYSAAKVAQLIEEAPASPAPPAEVSIVEPSHYQRLAVLLIFQELLRDRDRDLRQAAAESLGLLGDKQAVPALTDALQDIDGGVQYAATRSLEALNRFPV